MAKTRQCVPSVQGRQGVTLTLPARDPHQLASHVSQMAGKGMARKLGLLGRPHRLAGLQTAAPMSHWVCSQRSVLQDSTSRACPHHTASGWLLTREQSGSRAVQHDAPAHHPQVVCQGRLSQASGLQANPNPALDEVS